MAPKPYTCSDYRAEMRLLGLRRRLSEDRLTEPQRLELLREIRNLESEMGMD